MGSAFVQQLTTRLHDSNPYLQSFTAPREWATPVETPNTYYNTTHSNRRSTAEHIRHSNGPRSSETATINYGAEFGFVICRR